MRQQVLCQLIIICDGLVFHGVFLGSAQCSGDKLQIHWVKMNRNGIQAPTHTLGEGRKKIAFCLYLQRELTNTASQEQ